MAGLLDFIKTGTTGDKALDQGLLQAGLALLQGRGNFGANLGRAGMQALTGADSYRQNQFQQTLQKNQLEELQRKRVLEDLPGQFIKPAQTVPDNIGGMDTAVENPANYVPPKMDLAGLAQKYLGTPGGLQQGLALQQSLKKDTTPIVLGKNDRLLEKGTNKVLVGAEPDKPDQTPVAKLIAERAALPPGSPLVSVYDDAIKKATTHTPPVSVNVNPEKAFAQAIGPIAAKNIEASQSAAEGAQASNATITAIQDAMSKGGVMLGPGAGVRQVGKRIGQVLGAGSKESADSLANTKAVEQGLAQIELDAAQLMKGQGAITGPEREIIKRAAAGEIEKLTPQELDIAMKAIKRNNDQKIATHQRRMQQLPGAGTGGLAPLLDVVPPTQVPGVRRFNPATGKIE